MGHGPLTDLLVETPEGPRLPPTVHHLPDLLELAPEEILARFRTSQTQDFQAIIADLERSDAPLRRLFESLRQVSGESGGFGLALIFRPGGLSELFSDLHDHVMTHPVWRHPFFVRVFTGPLTDAQVRRFLLNYFNQVKNTRQCVALAIGRFHGLVAFPYGAAAQPVSELTQVVLAQLIADEYGVGTSGLDDYPSLDSLFRSTTHITLYRRLLDALSIPLPEQDIPLLPEVADNVLTQRLVAGHEAFSPLEALASVGLGMEWGVPEFFSLLLGGLIRHAAAERLELTAHDLDILIAHVKYDVLHAVSVMAATALHMRSEGDVMAVKTAVNMLMAARYDMMSGVYEAVFETACPRLRDIQLADRWKISDDRIGELLLAERRKAGVGTVHGQEGWQSSITVPFAFKG